MSNNLQDICGKKPEGFTNIGLLNLPNREISAN